MSWDGKRILIAGGAGFVGSNLTRARLGGNPREVIVIDNLLSSERKNLPDDPRLTFIEGSINSDELLDRIHPPGHLFIIGGGYVGCEFAAIYRGFGCQVTLAEERDRLLSDWDESVGAYIAQKLAADGVELMLGQHISVSDLPVERWWRDARVGG